MELPAIRKLNVGKRKSGFGSSRHKNSNLSSCYLAPLSTRDNLDLASSSVPNKENGPLLPAVHTRGRLGSLITTVGNGPPFPARVIQQTRCDIEERPVLTLAVSLVERTVFIVLFIFKFTKEVLREKRAAGEFFSHFLNEKFFIFLHISPMNASL